jgi:hypothetical protein
MRQMRQWLAVVAVGMLAGCSSTLKPASPDPKTGHFPTISGISPGGVQKAEKFDPKYLQMLYVKTDSKSDRLNTFYLQTFTNMGRFQKVVGKDELEGLVIQRGLADKVQNISDMIGLKNLSNVIGPFLVVEPTAEYKGGYNYGAALKTTDAETGIVVLLVKNSAINWAGLDEPLFYPLFNVFLDWTSGQEVVAK